MSTIDTSRETQSRKIQILRALAITAVVAIHTCSFGRDGILIRPFVNFAVALFLGLSGYLTRDQIAEVPAFYKKRLTRVLIPYTIWSLIYTAIRGTWAQLPLHYVTGYSSGVLYYIIVYVQLTLLAPVIGKLLRSKYRLLGYLITPVALVIECLIEVAGCHIDQPYNELPFVVWFGFYYLGMDLRRMCERETAPAWIGVDAVRRKLAAAASVLLLLSFPLQSFEGFLWHEAGISRMPYTQLKLTSMITSGLVILLAILWIRNNRPIHLPSLLTRWMVYLGDVSFGVYLSHILIRTFLEDYVYEKISFTSIFPLPVFEILAINVLLIALARRLLGSRASKALGLI